MAKPVTAELVDEVEWTDGSQRQAIKITVNDEVAASTSLSADEARKLHLRIERLVGQIGGSKKRVAPVNGLALAAMILGIASFTTMGASSLVGAPMSHKALKRSADLEDAGRKMAIVGMVCSYLWIGIWVTIWSLGLLGQLVA